MLSLLIIGGGIHGTFLSHTLTATGAVEREKLRVLDPHAGPLAEWYRTTAACGMRFLRSPSSHNLEPRFNALRDYAAATGRDEFIPPYMRPSLRLFNDHCRYVVRKHGLQELRISGQAEDIRIEEDGVTVSTGAGSLRAEQVMICVGRAAPLCRPAWADTVPGIRHVYEPGFSLEDAARAERPLVVGAGIGALQLACALADRGARQTVLLSREPVRIEQFDSDPCYIGPRCLEGFQSIEDPQERIGVIRRVRNPGTVPADVAAAFRERLRSGSLRHRLGGIESVEQTTGGLQVRVRTGNGAVEEIRTDRLLLATGFRAGVPAEDLVRRIAHRHGLPLGPNGFPLLDRALRWHPRVFVTGYLAELELGPPCGNIIGAHLAARRLVPFFLSGKSIPPVTTAWTPLAAARAGR